MTALFELWLPRTGFNFVYSVGYYLDIWVPLLGCDKAKTLRLSAITHIPDLLANPYIDWADTQQESQRLSAPDRGPSGRWSPSEGLGFHDLRNMLETQEQGEVRHSLAFKVSPHRMAMEDVISSNLRNTNRTSNCVGSFDLSVLANCFKVPEIGVGDNLTWSKLRLRPNMDYSLVRDLRFGLLDLDSWSPAEKGLRSLQQVGSADSAPLWA